MEWTLNTLRFYNQARLNIARSITSLVEGGVNSAVLYGISELVEIAVIVASEAGLKIEGIVDDAGMLQEKLHLGCPVLDFEQLKKEPPKALIVCIELNEETMAEINGILGETTKIYRLM
jgi:hypothetical protein